MNQQNQAILTTELSQQITSCAFSKDDLKNLCEILQESSLAAAEDEISHYAPMDRPIEQIVEDKNTLRSGFELQVNVLGIDNKGLTGTIPAVFNSPRFPNKVKSLYIDSEFELNNLHNWSPRNRFRLFIDFTKPDIFNLSLSPSISTPNDSHILVNGLNSDWVSGVYTKVTDFIKDKRTRRTFFHKHSVYDFILLLIGLPFAFWLAYKLSGVINSIFGEFSIFVQNGVYVGLFFLVIHLFRALFIYARWGFPIVEYIGTSSITKKHRYIWGSLVLAVFGNFLYDLIKIVVTLIT